MGEANATRGLFWLGPIREQVTALIRPVAAVKEFEELSRFFLLDDW